MKQPLFQGTAIENTENLGKEKHTELKSKESESESWKLLLFLDLESEICGFWRRRRLKDFETTMLVTTN